MFIDKFSLTDVNDEELRKSVAFLIEKGVLTERDIVAVTVSRELAAGVAEGGQTPAAQVPNKSAHRGNGGGNGGRKRRPARRAPDASRKLQGQYLAALNSVPKSKRNQFRATKFSGGRAEAVAAIRKAYPRAEA